MDKIKKPTWYQNLCSERIHDREGDSLTSVSTRQVNPGTFYDEVVFYCSFLVIITPRFEDRIYAEKIVSKISIPSIMNSMKLVIPL